jgi:DNA repair protein RadC
MAITDWPAAERPREKMRARGADALSDAELLAIFLRTGITGRTAIDLARELLEDFGGLRPLLAAERGAFCRRLGLGEAKFTQLQAVLEMGRRHLDERLLRGEALTSTAATRRYLAAQLRDRPYEVYPREVVKAALGHNAAAVILSHNHPSGVAEPSGADRRLTQRLRDALGLVDIRVLDHLVVGDETPVSFAERGLI